MLLNHMKAGKKAIYTDNGIIYIFNGKNAVPFMHVGKFP